MQNWIVILYYNEKKI